MSESSAREIGVVGAKAWADALEHSASNPRHILVPDDDPDGVWRGHMYCADDGTSEPPGAEGFGCGFDTREGD
jgi:hypothetical protein